MLTNLYVPASRRLGPTTLYAEIRFPVWILPDHGQTVKANRQLGRRRQEGRFRSNGRMADNYRPVG
jgi:hypothetical protein